MPRPDRRRAWPARIARASVSAPGTFGSLRLRLRTAEPARGVAGHRSGRVATEDAVPRPREIAAMRGPGRGTGRAMTMRHALGCEVGRAERTEGRGVERGGRGG